MNERIIKKVIRNKSNDQLLVTIPKFCHIKEGDYVELIVVPKISSSEKID